jgi:hypothetical protein
MTEIVTPGAGLVYMKVGTHVEVDATPEGDGGYVVALRARLVEPYFVRLAGPYVEARIAAERHAA